MARSILEFKTLQVNITFLILEFVVIVSHITQQLKDSTCMNAQQLFVYGVNCLIGPAQFRRQINH